jgi:hypothetical protein
MKFRPHIQSPAKGKLLALRDESTHAPLAPSQKDSSQPCPALPLHSFEVRPAALSHPGTLVLLSKSSETLELPARQLEHLVIEPFLGTGLDGRVHVRQCLGFRFRHTKRVLQPTGEALCRETDVRDLPAEHVGQDGRDVVV